MLFQQCKNGMLCQSVILNSSAFFIPAHAELCCICLFVYFFIALGLCLLNCYVQHVQMSIESNDGRKEQNDPVSLL